MNTPPTTEVTPTVSLRRLGLEDTSEYYDRYEENRAHIAAHSPAMAKGFMYLSEVAEQFAPFNAVDKHYFAIMQGEEFVGSTYLRLRKNQEAELGYWVDRHHIRQGIATVACRQTINYAFLHAGRRYIDAVIAPTNSASINTVQRLGFSYSHSVEHGLVYALDGRHI